MPRAAHERNWPAARIVAASLIGAIGIGLMASGTSQLQTLGRAYRSEDIALTETPDTFKLWLAGLARSGNADPMIVRRVADRLAVMPRPARRRAVINMARAAFWSDIQSAEGTRRVTTEQVLDAILLALHGEPAAGDLYFAAAWLETSVNGYSSRARGLLAASRSTAPREFDLAVERLILSAQVWRFMSAGERRQARADFDLVLAAHPQLAARITEELAREGVRFD